MSEFGSKAGEAGIGPEMAPSPAQIESKQTNLPESDQAKTSTIEIKGFEQGPIDKAEVKSALDNIAEKLDQFGIDRRLIELGIREVRYDPNQRHINKEKYGTWNPDGSPMAAAAWCEYYERRITIFAEAQNSNLAGLMAHESAHIFAENLMDKQIRAEYLARRNELAQQGKVHETDYTKGIKDLHAQDEERIAEDIRQLISGEKLDSEHQAALIAALQTIKPEQIKGRAEANERRIISMPPEQRTQYHTEDSIYAGGLIEPRKKKPWEV